MRTALKSWFLNSGASSILQFSGWTKVSTSPVLNDTAGTMRDQQTFKLDANNSYGLPAGTNAMVYSSGRNEIVLATSPENDPHNWTKQAGALIQSSGAGWDQQIDGCSIPYHDGSQWIIYYADEDSGQIGMATKSGQLGPNFTKYVSNPIVDNSANTGAWNQYLRHVCAFVENGVYYIICEARPNDPKSGFPRNIIRMTSNDGISFSQDSDPMFVQGDWPNSFFTGNAFWMPKVKKMSDGLYHIAVQALIDAGNTLGAIASYFVTGYTTDITDNTKWVLQQTKIGLVPAVGANGDFDDAATQEPSLYEPTNGTLFLYCNGSASNANARVMGYALINGSFNDVVPTSLVEDSFNDDTVDSSKWTASPQGGITLTESNYRLHINGNGVSSQSLVNVLTGITAIPSNEYPVWSMNFIYSRNTTLGGVVEVGMSNAAGTNKILIYNAGTSTQIGLKLVIGGVTLYSATVTLIQVRKAPLFFQIIKRGRSIGIYYHDPLTNAYQPLINGGTGTVSWMPKWVDVSTWPDEDIFPVVNAANDGANAYEVTVDELSVRSHDYATRGALLINGYWSNWAGVAYDRMSGLTAQQKTAIETFLASVEECLPWVSEFNIFGLSASNSLIGFRVLSLTNSGATHTGDAYDFSGSNSMAMNYNPSGDARWQQNDAMFGVYIKDVGNQTTTRFMCGNGANPNLYWAIDGAGNQNVRINQSNSGGFRVFAENWQNDTIYAITREDATAAGVKIYKNAVSQSMTGGAVSTGLSGNTVTLGGSFDGGLYAVWYGKAIGFDHDTWNTALRQLVIDLA